jgi:hypothetical protein
MSTNFEAASFNVAGDGKTDDTAACNAALAAAWEAAAKPPGYSASLHVPAGCYVMEDPLAPPGPVVGNLSIFGDPGDSTQFLFVNPTDGFAFPLYGAPYRFLNRVAVSEISILAGAACLCPLLYDYGVGLPPPDDGAETNRGSSMRRVSVGVLFNGEYQQATAGAGWTCGPKFNVCHALTLEDLFLYGSATFPTPLTPEQIAAGAVLAPLPTSGPGSGNALHFSSCMNLRAFGIYASQWNLPILLDNAGSGLTDCQGSFFGHIRGVGMGSLLTALGDPLAFPNGLADLNVTDFQLDNGYSGDAYQGGIDIEYGSDVKIDGGWIQAASSSGTLIRLNGCSGVKLSKSKLYASIPAPIVLLTGGTSGSFIEGGNTILGKSIGVQIDAGSKSNKIEQQGIGVVDPAGKAIVNNEPSTIFV